MSNLNKAVTVERRTLAGVSEKLLIAISVIWASFHLIVASGLYIPAPAKLRMIHLMFALIMVFMLAPAIKSRGTNKITILDWSWIGAAIGVLGYGFIRYETLVRMGGRYDPLDITVGIIGMVILFEAARRVVSPGLVILAALAFSYAFWGRYLPAPLTHAGYSTERLIQHLYLSGEGIFGFVLGVSAEIIIVFVLFGAVLEGVGVTEFFNDLANSIAGRTRGGPAKVAVISSALMGMVSGETSANVATTGTFTIPLMKRVGYQPYFAGAVECAASAGGQILPPIMGATAFVIADTLGISYIKLALAASIPAILYFVGVMATVHFRAVNLGLIGLSESEIPKFWTTMKKIYLMLPLLGIVILLVMDYTPTIAAFWGGIATAVALTMLNPTTRLNKEKIVGIMCKATRTAMSLAIACALVGIIVGVASITGITMTIAEIIFNATSGELFPALFMTMIVALILGMGLPTTAAYVLTAISAVPVLQRLGIPQMPAHLFVLYFGVLSALTPPVCTGAYTAAALAGSEPNKTGFASLRIALSGFIVPYLFIYANSLVLAEGWKFWPTLQAFITASVGIVLISSALEGALFKKLNIVERIVLFIGAVLAIIPENTTDYIGIAIVICFLAYDYYMSRKQIA